MEFYDVVTITVQSGRGGEGIATGRREKHVPFGGPSGGDGGDGGSIILQGARNEYTLLPFRMQRVFKAKHGEPGRGKDQYGKAAEDRILLTPLGTVIRDKLTGEELGVIEHEGQQLVLAQGGRGGLGNKHFVSAEKQFSTIGLLGEPGSKRDVIMELRLLSDIALIGFPSVGKSSIINLIANTKAKTAEYHFTTLIPNMGMVNHKDKTFSVIDIPGLIEGAHTGKGLGNAFLRHIVKSKLLLFVVDAGKYETGMEDVVLLFEELRQYVDQTVLAGHDDLKHSVAVTEHGIEYSVSDKTERLFHKFIGFVINKIDIVNDEEILIEYTQKLLQGIAQYCKKTYDSTLTAKDLTEYCIQLSAATTHGKELLLDFMLRIIHSMEQFEATQEVPEIPFKKQQAYVPQESQIIKTDEKTVAMLEANGYLEQVNTNKNTIRTIDNQEIAYLSYVLPRGNDEAELWYRSQLAQKGYLDEWEKVGFKKGDILHIVSPYAGVNDRFIIWE